MYTKKRLPYLFSFLLLFIILSPQPMNAAAGDFHFYTPYGNFLDPGRNNELQRNHQQSINRNQES